MPWNNIPDVEKCCGCIADLKTAVIIIAVLGIVTSPTVSWAIIRHSYMVRVSCIISTSATRPDVVDVNLNNILSFGFGANTGLGPSCLSPESANSTVPLVMAVKYLGWVALLFDLIFLMSSIYLLIRMSMGNEGKAVLKFMVAVSLSILVSFIYAMLYVSACLQIGGSFPVFEFIFAFVDVGIMALWIYFLLVLRCYIIKLQKDQTPPSYFSYVYWSTTLGNVQSYMYSGLGWLSSFFFRREGGSRPAPGSRGMDAIGMNFQKSINN